MKKLTPQQIKEVFQIIKKEQKHIPMHLMAKKMNVSLRTLHNTFFSRYKTMDLKKIYVYGWHEAHGISSGEKGEPPGVQK